MSGIPIKNILKEWKLGLLVYDKRNLVQISSKTTIEAALFVLQRENILALAVYDEEKGKEGILKILTIFDIMTYIAFGSFEIGQKEADAFEVFKSAKVPVSELLSVPIHTEDERVWIFKASDPIYKVLEPMSKGVHRVLIDLSCDGCGCDGDDQRVAEPQYRMLTQSDIVRFLSSYNLYEYDESLVDATKSVNELNMVSHINHVITMNKNTTALEVFRAMEINDVLALPLVDDDGKLVATFSSSDLRGLRSYQLKCILLPALEYLYLFRGPLATRSITCTSNDSLNDVIKKFVINRVHRVWVVDNDLKPVGVVSLSDIISKYIIYDV